MKAKLSFLARSVIVICMLVIGCSQAWAENRKVTVYRENTTAVSTDYACVKVDDGSTTYAYHIRNETHQSAGTE